MKPVKQTYSWNIVLQMVVWPRTLRRASDEIYTCSAVSTTGASLGGAYNNNNLVINSIVNTPYNTLEALFKYW